jgi:hypothetical protein
MGGVVLLASIGVWVAMHAGGADVGGAAGAVGAQADANCPGCTAEKASIPEDPVEADAVRRRLEEEQAARQAKAADESRQRALQWRGCQFVPTAKPEDGERFARQRQVAELLSARAPVPQARTDHFQWVLSNERFRCVGWYGTVAKVVDGPEGTVVELVARPHLVTRGGGIAHTPAASRETWRVDRQNNLVCERIEAEGGLPSGVMTY